MTVTVGGSKREGSECNFVFAFYHVIKVNASRAVEGDWTSSRRKFRVKQYGNTQLHFPWDEEVQGWGGGDDSMRGISTD